MADLPGVADGANGKSDSQAPSGTARTAAEKVLSGWHVVSPAGSMGTAPSGRQGAAQPSGMKAPRNVTCSFYMHGDHSLWS